MTRWERTTTDTICGGCGAQMPIGAPVLMRRLATVAAIKRRCEKCEGPAPPDLPPVIARAPVRPPSAAPVRFGGLLPLDWKQRALGEREPGE